MGRLASARPAVRAVVAKPEAAWAVAVAALVMSSTQRSKSS